MAVDVKIFSIGAERWQCCTCANCKLFSIWHDVSCCVYDLYNFSMVIAMLAILKI